MALNTRQKLFCKEYLKDFNATQAAVRAGYSKKTAYSIGNENLKKPEIQQYIQEQSNKRLDKVDVDVDYIIENIIEVTERCMQKSGVEYFDKIDKEWKPVKEYISVGDGEEVEAQVYQFDSRGALKGLELLGKYKNIFNENIKLSGDITTTKKDMSAISSIANQMQDISEDDLNVEIE